MQEFISFCKIIKSSSTPEEIFGKSPDSVGKRYREIAKIIHPDHNPKNQATAEQIFKLLNSWKEKAEERIRLKIYGLYSGGTSHVASSPHTSKVAVGNYELTQKLFSGDLSQIFLATDLRTNEICLLKIALSHQNNDLLANEAKNLKAILDLKLKTSVHLPRFIESFQIKNKHGVLKHVNVFRLTTNVYYSLEEVHKKYPSGIPASASAWIFNRVLAGLFACHASEIVHGSILPSHILICPKTHNAKIIDFSYSTDEGSKIKAIVPKYKDFYPNEIFDKISSLSSDIFMAAKCIEWISEKNLPREISGFLKYCTINNYRGRPNAVDKLFDEFKDVLSTVFGKPKFVEFIM